MRPSVPLVGDRNPQGCNRLGMTGYSLYPGNLLITCRFLVNFLVASRKKRNFDGKLYKYTKYGRL